MQDFEDFVALRSQALLRTAYLLCGGDRGAAEDILQDVLMGMYGEWRRIRTSPEAYARTALANSAANRWRRRSRKPEAPSRLLRRSPATCPRPRSQKPWTPCLRHRPWWSSWTPRPRPPSARRPQRPHRLLAGRVRP